MSTIVEQLTPKVIEHASALAQRAADATVTAVQAKTSRRTGHLHDGISHDIPVYADPRVVCTITASSVAGGADQEYANYANEGTGLYGPQGVRIFPTRAKVLVFDWPAAGGTVFARSVAGAPGEHFWDDLASQWPTALFELAGAP